MERDLSDHVCARPKTFTTLQRIVENNIIIWLDSNLNESDIEYQTSVALLKTINNWVHTFNNDLDQCVDFIHHRRSEKLFIIVSDIFVSQLLTRIREVAQIHSIYVLRRNRSNNIDWTKNWSKVKGIYKDIQSLCTVLQSQTHLCEHDCTPITMVSSTNTASDGSNELDQSFMYSQILKEILLDMPHDIKVKAEFVKFCRELYIGNTNETLVIDEFEHYYPCIPAIDEFEQDSSPIWWYTRDSFLYRMLNKALRTQDTEIIIKMGFFMRDIHRQIEELHYASIVRDSFVVYRGQSMGDSEFENIKKSKGRLLSFNSFLSTSIDREVAFSFTDYGQTTIGVTSVLFRMLIDPSSCFAFLGGHISFFKHEKEVLLSMHTIFRISGVQQLRDHLWEVELQSTKDDDDELKTLSAQIRKEIGVGIGWDRLGALLVKMGEFDKAESIYMTLRSLIRDDDWRMLAHLNNQLGYIMKQKSDLSNALVFYQNAFEIQQGFLPPIHLDLAATFTNIGSVHDSMGDFTIALTFYQKALEIKLKFLSCDDSSLATAYNNIGSAHDSIRDYPTALSFYEKALRIQEKSLPSNHPSLATTFNNIGKIYRTVGDYPAALSFYQKACDIFQRTLPPNHPSLAIIYNNIGHLHDSMGDYHVALSFYQKTLDIKEKSLHANHLSFATTYNNIAFVHKSLGNYTAALSFYQKALDLSQRVLSSNHQDITDLKEQIALMKRRV